VCIPVPYTWQLPADLLSLGLESGYSRQAIGGKTNSAFVRARVAPPTPLARLSTDMQHATAGAAPGTGT
jgi:hypothetical protein